jgi:hypothetical protein
MRRLRGTTAAAALALLVCAAPAAASNEISDPCGANVSPSLSYPYDPTVPWFDLCAGDVSGVAGSGSLRAIKATLHLAGDASGRHGLGAYSFTFSTPRCGASATSFDPDLSGGSSSVRLAGQCNLKPGDCGPLAQLGFVCSGTGDAFDVLLPAKSAAISGSTVTFTVDPNGLRVPRALTEDLAGGVLSSVGAVTWEHVGAAGGGERTALSNPADQAFGTKSVSLNRRR